MVCEHTNIQKYVFVLYVCVHVYTHMYIKKFQVVHKSWTIFSRHWFGSVDRASAWGLKGPGVDSCQGRVPWLRAHPQ